MTNYDLERKLASALSRSAPNDFEGVLSRCSQQKGTVIQMTTKKKNHHFRNLIAACLALALVGGGGTIAYQQNYAVASIVSLDVNPSIELKVNKNEKVLLCEALNPEAETVLANMNGGADLKGTKLNVAVNAVVGSLTRNGYLDSISSAILISVEDGDQARASLLQQKLTAEVDTLLQANSSEAAVFSQTVKKDAAMEKQAKENHISTGKASLVNQVLSLNNTLTFESLSALSVEELKDLLETSAPGMPIGKNAAAEKALQYAGAPQDGSVRWEADAELDDRPAHYEVDIYTSFGELEYRVDAYTGEILRGKADAAANALPASPPSAPASPPASPAVSGSVDKNSAISIALSHAGLSEDQVRGLRAEKDGENGRMVYEIEFKAGNMEYDYTVDASSGAVLEHEKERND